MVETCHCRKILNPKQIPLNSIFFSFHKHRPIRHSRQFRYFPSKHQLNNDTSYVHSHHLPWNVTFTDTAAEKTLIMKDLNTIVGFFFFFFTAIRATERIKKPKIN